MVFVTVGSQKFQFDRLLRELDRLVEQGTITGEVFAQTGVSGYIPRHFCSAAFLDADEFARMEERAELVITHGGSGAILGAVKRGKKVIAVPRLSRYGEHVDDHQLQLLREFERMRIIRVCFHMEELGKLYLEVMAQKEPMAPYRSGREQILEDIDNFLNGRET